MTMKNLTKKIINELKGHKVIALLSNSNWPSLSDSDYWQEELLLTKAGKYILYAEGGANTQYRDEWGNPGWTERSKGYKYCRMTQEEAEKWLEESKQQSIENDYFVFEKFEKED